MKAFRFAVLMCVLVANLKQMEDVPPTQPTRTNRFPSVVSRPQTVPTPKGTIFPAPTASPAQQ